MLANEIRESVNRLIVQPGFTAWLSNEGVAADDWVVVNNSFVFRGDVKTVKAKAFVTLSRFGPQPLDLGVEIAEAPGQNVDFKRFTGPGKSLLNATALESAVDEQLADLGSLIFLLIGEIEDTVVLTEEVDHAVLESVVWDPSVGQSVILAGREVTTGRVNDEEVVWEAVVAEFDAKRGGVPEGLRDAVGISLDKLQARAEAVVRIPQTKVPSNEGITDSILKVLAEQHRQYIDALNRLSTSIGADMSALNDVLRIAYNFSSDASGYLKLIVSICDLKPLVLWGTVAEHYALSEAFRHLPWTRSRKKPTLKNYQETVADARNSAFHNLFPFKKTLRVHLPQEAIGDPSLRIFSEHGKRRDNELSYRDKELVDVLVEFTRARERQVPLGFWQRNGVVMEKTIELFSATNAFVKQVRAAN